MAGTCFYISSTETPPVSPPATSGGGSSAVMDRGLSCDAWGQMSVSQAPDKVIK